ncbi:MAG: hypothetical protein JSW11_08715 [Candidatus Heimdallarchaeota archaeon]|nr:MAG: hypothetical protein JSW11_08715 [Candidatus Heimdallarchaeota archaeon]
MSSEPERTIFMTEKVEEGVKLVSEGLIKAKKPRKEQFFLQSVTIIFFLVGLFCTYTLLIIAYGDEALVKFFKGISVQNLIDIIIDLNVTELLVMFYFLLLFGVLFSINNFFKVKFLSPRLNERQQSVIDIMIKYFREGSFTLPFIIMVVFPLMLQVILPGLINIVAIVEILIPFIIIGELYHISEESLKSFYKNKDYFRREPRLMLEYIAGMLLAFPLGVYILIETGLIRFFNLVHYTFLWPNPNSPIALSFWEIINSLISVNNIVSSFFDSSLNHVVVKYFVVAFIFLVITSKLYLIFKRFIRIHTFRQIERFILTYQ